MTSITTSSLEAASLKALDPADPHEDVKAGKALTYMSGFGAEHSSEALPGALPVGQNGPQICPYGLYAEQLSGTAFTVPRAKNQRSWLYRIRPSVLHEKFVPIPPREHLVSDFSKATVDPNQLRWFPPEMPKPLSTTSAGAATAAGAASGDASSSSSSSSAAAAPAPKARGKAAKAAAAASSSSSSSAAGGAASSSSEGEVEAVDFVDGIKTMCGVGDSMSRAGCAVHVYTCNADMVDTCFMNSDGDLLIVPQTGTLHIQTEFGFLDVAPKEIVVIQRGIRFRVWLDGPSRGYIMEIYTGHFTLPDLGPIGANGLANPRDFLVPVAAYEDRDVDYVVVNKFGGKLFSTTMHHSPFDIVAWHGNYVPYKYDLTKFNTMNSVSFDHPDPSIYTVLTCPTDTPGVALCDFVIFPPRWMVMDHSFRPPYYHRNVMSEFMGMVHGKYDAKVGFQPGGASLHSCMTSHGPDAPTFLKASTTELKPEYFGGGLAFMFESYMMWKLTDYAMKAPHRDIEYARCWSTLPRVFDPAARDMKTLAIKGHAAGEGSHGMASGPLLGDGTSAALATAAGGAGTGGAAAAGGAGTGGAAAPPAAKRVATGAAGGAAASAAATSAEAEEEAAPAATSSTKTTGGPAASGDKRKRR